MSEVSPQEAKARLHSGGEIAFLDVREAGQFGEGHPLFAVPCPYSRLELTIPALVPNRRVPVVLIDAGDGVAEKAATRLEALGYSDISVIEGGAPGWQAAGLTLFKGVNVPSKALGELAETIWHPAMIDAATLRSWTEEGRDFRFFDARPPAEYSKMRVPGAVCLPNGELAHRFDAAVPEADTPVLITCAGRTRGIVGAIGLKLAGVPNPVFALENGTQGWALAGEPLERGAKVDPPPILSEAAFGTSRERAQAVCEERSIPWIDRRALEELQADTNRTTYLFDVRSIEGYRVGHLPGAIHAPSGQLVQASDQWMAVRHARVVLADDAGLRAALAAFWLRQLGFETFVLPDIGEPVEPGGAAEPAAEALPPITPEAAAAAEAAGTHSPIDLRSSRDFREGHPIGAVWSIRPRLAATLSGWHGPVILVADDPALAYLAAKDLKELGVSEISLLQGGIEEWHSGGLPVEVSPERPSTEDAIDFLQFVHDRHDGNLESSRRYLAWEQGLVDQFDAEERAEFRLERPAA